MMKLHEFIEKYGDREIVDLEKFESSLEKPKPRTAWDLRDGDTFYWFRGRVNEWKWDNSNEVCLELRESGNVFLTYEEASKDLDRRKIEVLLKKHAKGHKFEYNKNNFYIGYEHREKRILIYWESYIRLGGEVYFASYEDAEKAIEKIGKDRLIEDYFQVEMEESKDGDL